MTGTTESSPIEARFSNRHSAFGCVVVVTMKKEWRDEAEGEQGERPVSQSATGCFHQELSGKEKTLSPED